MSTPFCLHIDQVFGHFLTSWWEERESFLNTKRGNTKKEPFIEVRVLGGPNVSPMDHKARGRISSPYFPKSCKTINHLWASMTNKGLSCLLFSEKKYAKIPKDCDKILNFDIFCWEWFVEPSPYNVIQFYKWGEKLLS